MGNALDTSDNALNFLRLVLAAMVLFAHTWWVGGFGGHWSIYLGPAAVAGFFTLSGFLIAGSRVRSSLRKYLASRALRILPAYWVVLLVTAFGFAPLAGVLEPSAQYVVGSGIEYVTKNLFLRQWVLGIDHTLVSTPLKNIWNGSLWTLFYEFSAYLVAGALLTPLLLRRTARVWLSVLVVGVPVATWLAIGVVGVTEPLITNTLQLAAFFVTGMAAWAWRAVLPLRWWLCLLCAASAAALFWWGSDLSFHCLSTVPITYALLYLGARLPVRIGARNDISYGFYIYAYPVQQLMAASGAAKAVGYLGNLVAVLGATTVLAWISWRVVEQPALRLKARTR